jgi:hypothetical protein
MWHLVNRVVHYVDRESGTDNILNDWDSTSSGGVGNVYILKVSTT